MAYSLSAVTIRTDNSPAGIARIQELWRDIASGKLPLMFDSRHGMRTGISPVSRYSRYENGDTGMYDLTVFVVTSGFFDEMERKVASGLYRKYDVAGGNFAECARMAWEQVWRDAHDGRIVRAFTQDYEYSMRGEYAADGKPHCILYIAVVQ